MLYVPNAVRFTRFDKVLDHFPVSKGHAYERSVGFIASVAQVNGLQKTLKNWAVRLSLRGNGKTGFPVPTI